jgi:hypothetical protein
MDEQATVRTRNALCLDRLLAEIEGIDPLARLPSTTRHSYHIYMFRYHPEAFAGLGKARFVQALQAEGIDGAFAGYTSGGRLRAWPADRLRRLYRALPGERARLRGRGRVDPANDAAGRRSGYGGYRGGHP